MRQTQRVLFILAAASALLAAQDDPPGRAGRLAYLAGSASFQPAGVDDWVDATMNRTLTTGDHLWVGDGGRAEVQVGSTAYRLNSNTAFQFLNLDDATEQVSLSEGTLTVRLRRPEDGQTYEVDTPNVAITLLQSGAYRIDADPNSQTTTLTVWGGTAEVTGGGQAFTVHPREQAVINGDQQITFNVQGAPGPDALDNWSGGRDRLRDESVFARYVAPEITSYEYLDANGRLANSPDYGQVWYPTAVSAGWAPYRYGHWAWVAPWGWTWVDDASWGFAPFHYGRWAYVGGAWGWCPGPMAVRPVYAPALVAWVGGGGGGGFGVGFAAGAAVAWFALGPREPFFPGYHVSQGYFTNVNVSNTVINRTVINNYYNTTYINNRTTNITNVSYVNQRVTGAVVAVPQNQFASGQSVGRIGRVVAPAQLQRGGVMMAPSVAPQRESVLGLHAATAGRAARPPATIMARPVVARATPPPPPVSFARQQSILAQNPGRMIATAAIQQIRQSAPVQRRTPVRIAAPVQSRPTVVVQPRAAQPGVVQPRPVQPGAAQPVPTRPAQPTPAYRPPDRQQPVTPAYRPPQQQPAAPAYRPPPQQQPSTVRPTPERPTYTAPQDRPQPTQRPAYTPPPERTQPTQRPAYTPPPERPQPAQRPAYTPPPERPQTERVNPPAERRVENTPRPNRPPEPKPKPEDKKPEHDR